MNRAQPSPIASPTFRSFAVWGPGLLVMLADTDVDNVVTASPSGDQLGYRLLPLLFLLIPLLFMAQELTVRLGIFTGKELGELIKETPHWMLETR